MSTGDAARPPSSAAAAPSPAEVLRWCAARAPDLWFPSTEARSRGVARESLDEPVWQLRQAGLIHVVDWVRGRGQGYAVTPDGLQSLNASPPPAAVEPVPKGEPESPSPDAVATPYDRGELTREAFLAPRPAVVVPALLVVLTGWYFVSFVAAWRTGAPLGTFLHSGDVPVLSGVGGVAGPDLVRGEWWRLVTCGFVHVGVLHLLGNLFALALLGPVAEGLWGRWRFIGLYLVAGLAANGTAIALHPTLLVAGATGAVWGMQLAIIAWLVRYRAHLPATTLAEWVRRLLLVLGVNVVLSLAPGVCWECHFAGAAAGVVTAALLDLTRPGASTRKKMLGALGLLLFVAGFLGGFAWYTNTDAEWVRLRKLPQTAAPKPVPAPDATGISPSRVNALHKQATIALVSQIPAARMNALDANAALMAEATQAVARVPTESAAAQYLAEVLRYTQLLQARLVVDRLPTAEESQSLSEQRALIERMWADARPP